MSTNLMIALCCCRIANFVELRQSYKKFCDLANRKSSRALLYEHDRIIFCEVCNGVRITSSPLEVLSYSSKLTIDRIARSVSDARRLLLATKRLSNNTSFPISTETPASREMHKRPSSTHTPLSESGTSIMIDQPSSSVASPRADGRKKRRSIIGNRSPDHSDDETFSISGNEEQDSTTTSGKKASLPSAKRIRLSGHASKKSSDLSCRDLKFDPDPNALASSDLSKLDDAIDVMLKKQEELNGPLKGSIGRDEAEDEWRKQIVTIITGIRAQFGGFILISFPDETNHSVRTLIFPLNNFSQPVNLPS